MVKKSMEANNFSFFDFYFNRAKRLLPAAYTTFISTAVISYFILDQSSIYEFSKQLVGAVTFTANFALQKQSGYFENASELKPLLHTWSLAIEEQYYLLLPITMLILPKKSWLPATILAVISGFILCYFWSLHNPTKAFYMLPSRAWELGIGSLGALLPYNKVTLHRYTGRLFIPAMTCIIALPFFNIYGQHPGINAVIICFATVSVIICNNSAFNQSLITKN